MSFCPFMSPLTLHESCRVHPSHLCPDRLLGLALTGTEDLEEADWLCQCVVWMLLSSPLPEEAISSSQSCQWNG